MQRKSSVQKQPYYGNRKPGEKEMLSNCLVFIATMPSKRLLIPATTTILRRSATLESGSGTVPKYIPFVLTLPILFRAALRKFLVQKS